MNGFQLGSVSGRVGFPVGPPSFDDVGPERNCRYCRGHRRLTLEVILAKKGPLKYLLANATTSDFAVTVAFGDDCAHRDVAEYYERRFVASVSRRGG
jgi:hypothetical protein